MKRGWGGMMLLCLALLSLSACGSPTVQESAVPTAPPVKTLRPTPTSAAPTVTPTAVPTPAPTPAAPPPVMTPPPTPSPTERPPERPDDEAVLEQYRLAEEAYSWFSRCSDSGLELDLEDVYLEPEGEGERTFYRVRHPELNSLDDLRGHLKSLFSDEIVDELLSEHSPFREGTEGGLYALPAEREKDPSKGAVTMAVLWPEEEGEPSRCTVQVSAELLAPEDQGPQMAAEEARYEFPYQKVGDKWLFTWFESIF